MPYNPEKHHRRSIRLKGYDYTSPGSYFVTICTQGFVCLFGRVIDGVVIWNHAGRMVQRVWETIPRRFPTVRSDSYVIMPNHFHAIITIRRGDPCGRPDPCGPPGRAGTANKAGARPTPTGTDRPALGDLVGAFKSITTHEYIIGVRNGVWPPFEKRIWQRSYWEHVIRNHAAYERIKHYIEDNPARWDNDRLHPHAPPNPPPLPSAFGTTAGHLDNRYRARPSSGESSVEERLMILTDKEMDQIRRTLEDQAGFHEELMRRCGHLIHLPNFAFNPAKGPLAQQLGRFPSEKVSGT